MTANHTNTRYLDLIFPANLSPGDVEIITPAQVDRPGRAKLLAARVESCNGSGSRVYTANGGALIGVISYDDPWWPYEAAYWLEDSNV